MSIISAALYSPNNTVIVSRQFIPVSRDAIESLLSAYPQLKASQHKPERFLETDEVRFLSAPIGDYSFVLMTHKASNTVEDLRALEVLTEVVKAQLTPTTPAPAPAGAAGVAVRAATALAGTGAGAGGRSGSGLVTPAQAARRAHLIAFACDEAIQFGQMESGLQAEDILTRLRMQSEAEQLYKLERERQQQIGRQMVKERTAELANARKTGANVQSAYSAITSDGLRSIVSDNDDGETPRPAQPTQPAVSVIDELEWPGQAQARPQAVKTVRSGAGMSFGETSAAPQRTSLSF